MRSSPAFVLAAGMCLAHSAAAMPEPDVEIITMARPGDPVEGLPGITLASAGGGATINDAGQILTASLLAGPGVTNGNNRVVMFVDRTGHDVLVRQGEAVPGAPGRVYWTASINTLGVQNLVLTPGGGVVYQADVLFNSSVASAGISIDPTGNDTALIYVGGPAPGITPAANVSVLYLPNSGIGNGLGVFLANVPGVGRTLFTGDAGFFDSWFSTGDPAPIGPPGATFLTLDDGSLQANQFGRVAFMTVLSGGGLSTSNRTFIAAGPPDQLVPVAQTGTSAPDIASTTYSSFDPDMIVINNNDVVAFTTDVSGPVTDEAIMLGTFDHVRLFLKDGDPAPGLPGLTLNNLGSARLELNDNNELMFNASLVGPGVTTSNDSALFVGGVGDVRPIVREGDPGPSGGTFPQIAGNGFYAFNDRAQVVFETTIDGSRSMMATSPSGALVELARAGTVFMSDDGFVGGIGALASWGNNFVASTTGRGRPTVLNNNGEFVLTINFAGSTGNGLFRFTINDPCTQDTDGSGTVDFGDLTIVLGNWLNDYLPGTGPGDANGDGLVNFNDVTTVLGAWLQVCP